MLQFQYFSDIHTEFIKHTPNKIYDFNIEVKAPYLLLAGDIGNPFTHIYERLLQLLSLKFKHIILVAGNHEYYQTKLTDTTLSGNEWIEYVNQKIRSITKEFPNITFLQNEVYHIPDTNLSIFGGTFWTNVKAGEEDTIPYSISDYRLIPGFTVELSRELHSKACMALDRTLSEYPTREFIVMSHHLPTYDLIHPKYQYTKINSAFATDIPCRTNHRILAWVAGHTHTPIQIEKYYVNPIGYPGENKNSSFNLWFCI
jgi:predicted phosphohydrolase